MHRAYQPILPCGNKYLQQKWDKTYYDEHQRKVQTAKPMVDASSPRTYGHLNLKLKKLKLEEERLSIIERDNRLLMEKMSCIMRTKGGVDNRNNYELKSLNREKREQELLKVSRENQNILERIERCEPQYRVQKWAEDYQKAEQYMDSIAKYPRGWYNTQNDKQRPKGCKKTEGEPGKNSKKKDESPRNDTEEPKPEEKASKNVKQLSKPEGADGKREEVKKQVLKKDNHPKTEKVQSKTMKNEKQKFKNEKLTKERKEKEKDEDQKVESVKSQSVKGESETEEEEENKTEDELPKEESEDERAEEMPQTDRQSPADEAESNMEEAEQE